MPNKMLIDASHPEETRVVVVHGSRIEEFDFESQDKKQLRGNIYLARVTRVEPSLQAAFVEYGGNRHGFLAFSEIHPDYYQIPIADRQALLLAEAEENRNDDDDDDGSSKSSGGRKRRRGQKGDNSSDAEDSSETIEANTAGPISEINGFSNDPDNSNDSENDDADDADSSAPSMAAAVTSDSIVEKLATATDETSGKDAGSDDDHSDDHSDDSHEDSGIDVVGGGDAIEEAQSRRRPARRHYKIQEVIKRRQILLVQVVKEERGNKGAALTTYLSLAGRYSVLMPNTARGGGISRKITNLQDRKRLKEVVKDLEVPEGMGVILRTAGEARTKPEIKRDYDYLMRLWESVRTLTLKSVAPALVYEEGSLIKRAVRDLYNKDIDQIQVAGEEAYREAKDFMRMLMPSHAKVVQPYRDQQPVFARNGIEAQLDKILLPQVTLKSGGYIIINQTEALVAVDVNSGRSTKEHSIEDTALQTNLEAAEEVARQLRLRDLAGLIVIDFIDMEESRNNRAVEKRMKECLKNDRARIQVGRISHFGLLEMSRQRIRSSVLESTMQPCPHCSGTGQLRSDSSLALLVVRSIEEYLLKDSRNDIYVRTSTATALFLLNQKRQSLIDLESRFGVSISIETDDKIGHQHYVITKGEPSTRPTPVFVQSAQILPEFEDDEDDAIIEDGDETIDASTDTQTGAADEAQNEAQTAASNGEDGNGARKRRRKRRRRGGRDRTDASQQASEHDGGDENGDDDDTNDDASDDTSFEASDNEAAATSSAAPEAEATVDDSSAAKEDHTERNRRQRGRRGGRRTRSEGDATVEAQPEAVEAVTTSESVEAVEPSIEAAEPVAPEASAPIAEVPAEPVVEQPAAEAAPEAAAEAEAPVVEEKPKAKPRRPRVKKEAAATTKATAADKAASTKAPAKARAAKASPKAVTPAAEATVEPVPAQVVPAEVVPEKTVPVEVPEAVAEKPAARTPREEAPAETSGKPVVSSTEPTEAAPRKSGWWQRKSFF